MNPLPGASGGLDHLAVNAGDGAAVGPAAEWPNTAFAAALARLDVGSRRADG